MMKIMINVYNKINTRIFKQLVTDTTYIERLRGTVRLFRKKLRQFKSARSDQKKILYDFYSAYFVRSLDN